MLLTEQFINLCCAVLLDNNPKFTDTVIRDISFILDSYNEEDTAIQFRSKFELCKISAKYLFENNILSTPFVYPSVPKNAGVVRLIAGANILIEDVGRAVEIISRYPKK